MAEKTYSVVESLDRGLRILEMFTSGSHELTVTQIAEAGGIPIASAYRIIHTLERRGFLKRDRDQGPVKLGLQLLRLGALVQQGLDVRSAARPLMHQLADEVGETTVLLVPEEEDAVCVESFEGSSPIRPRSIAIGERRPYHAGAGANALLAHLTDAHLERVLARPLVAVTPKTPTDPEVLRKRIEDIRARGYAYSADELIEGTAAVAAPIFASGKEGAVASLGLTGLKRRVKGLEETAVKAAMRVSKELGA